MTDRERLDDWLQRSDQVADDTEKVVAMVRRDYLEQWEAICWAQAAGSSASASTHSCDQRPVHPAGLCEAHAHEILGI